MPRGLLNSVRRENILQKRTVMAERTPNHTPRDLAQRVHTKLSNTQFVPSIEVLQEFLQVVFLASLGTEEGGEIRCTFVYIRPGIPDPDPPRRIRLHRWTHTRFDKPIPFTVRSIMKAALSADPEISSFSVGLTGQHLFIYGLFDQQAVYRESMRHERMGRFSPPGIFQVEIIGLGHIRVTAESGVLGELRHAELAPESLDVLNQGLIQNALSAPRSAFISKVLDSICTQFGGRLAKEIADYTMSIAARRWTATIQRILFQTKAHAHGASFLFMDRNINEHLNIRYGLSYNRVLETLEAAVVSQVLEIYFESKIGDELDDEVNELSTDDYLGATCARGDSDDAERALTNSIAFVSGLSRIDGLVLMMNDLTVLGFGVEARAPDLSVPAVVSRKEQRSTGQVMSMDRYGTRHRAILRFCAAHVGTVGFIASEDGPVRAVLASTQRVTLWENVELYDRPSE